MRERRGGNTMQMVQKREKVSPLRRGVYRNLWLLALLAAVFLLGCNTGQYRVAPLEVFWTLLGKGSPTAQLVLIEFRLPRLCLAAMVGLGMGMSGVIMQDLLHNDLASPGTLGVSAGSGLFVTLYAAFFSSQRGMALMLPVLAMAGGLVSAGLIFLLGANRRKPLQPTRLIMTGVAMSSAYGAFGTFLTLLIDENRLEFLQRWQSGELGGTQWNYIAIFGVWLLVFLVLTYRQSYVLNVINIGYDVARGLGVNVGRQFVFLSFCAVALSSSSVAFGGNFFFLGLIGPHIARRLVGTDARVLLPASGIVAGIIVMLADMLVQGISLFANIPTGIIVSVLSVPYFLYLLIKS